MADDLPAIIKISIFHLFKNCYLDCARLAYYEEKLGSAHKFSYFNPWVD